MLAKSNKINESKKQLEKVKLNNVDSIQKNEKLNGLC